MANKMTYINVTIKQLNNATRLPCGSGQANPKRLFNPPAGRADWVLFNCLIIFVSVLVFSTSALASTNEVISTKQYDGIWFMGFNMHKDIFSGEDGSKVRKAFNMAIDRSYIVKTIIGDDLVPSGVIPPGMLGYSPDVKGREFDLSTAKKLMIDAGYPITDKRLKTLSMLHTDGNKTIEIAKWIKRCLIGLGVNLTLVEVKYSDGPSWERELKSGRHHLFLMGYKASTFGSIFIGSRSSRIFHSISCDELPLDDDQIFFGSFDEAAASGSRPCPVCRPEQEKMSDTYALLEPLFRTGGGANFMFYSNKRVDELLDQLEEMDVALSSAREIKFRELNRILFDDPPTVNLFYITKL